MPQNSQKSTSAIVSFLINEVAGWPATLLKKRLWRKCFRVSFSKSSRTPFLQNDSMRLPLIVQKSFSTEHLQDSASSYCRFINIISTEKLVFIML